MTFWWEHNGGKSYDTSHLIESIKRRNVNRQSASKYVTKLFKFTSIRLHDYYSQFNDHDRSNRLCVTKSTWLTYSPNSNRGKLKITQLQSQSSREKMLFSQTECQLMASQRKSLWPQLHKILTCLCCIGKFSSSYSSVNCHVTVRKAELKLLQRPLSSCRENRETR